MKSHNYRLLSLTSKREERTRSQPFAQIKHTRTHAPTYTPELIKKPKKFFFRF